MVMDMGAGLCILLNPSFDGPNALVQVLIMLIGVNYANRIRCLSLPDSIAFFLFWVGGGITPGLATGILCTSVCMYVCTLNMNREQLTYASASSLFCLSVSVSHSRSRIVNFGDNH